MSGRLPRQPVTLEWIETLHEHVRADFEKGQLYWKNPGRGKNLYKPIGCYDSNGYKKVTINYVNTYVHIVIYFLYYGEWPSGIIDHKDRCRHNNVPSNLIDTNHSGNAMNTGIWKTNTTGVKGVSWSTQFQKYKVTKQGRHLGYFDKLEHAALAYENG